MESRSKGGQLMITFKEYDDRTDQYVADEIKKRKLARHIVNATDDYRMKKGKAAFTMPHHTGSSTIHVYLRKMAGPSKGVMAYNYELKFDEAEDAYERADNWQAVIRINLNRLDNFAKAERILREKCPIETCANMPVSYTHLTLPTTPYV